MSSRPDSTSRLADLWERIPSDMDDVTKTARQSAALGRRLSAVTLPAAHRGVEQSAILARDSLGTVRALAEAARDPSDRRAAIKGLAGESIAIALRHGRGFAAIANSLRGDMMDILSQSRGHRASESAIVQSPSDARGTP